MMNQPKEIYLLFYENEIIDSKRMYSDKKSIKQAIRKLSKQYARKNKGHLWKYCNEDLKKILIINEKYKFSYVSYVPTSF